MTRNSNIELLRILAMMLIVFYHVAGNIMPNNELSFAEIIAFDCLGRWGILGVDCFVIITTFFLQEAKNINLKKSALY